MGVLVVLKKFQIYIINLVKRNDTPQTSVTIYLCFTKEVNFMSIKELLKTLPEDKRKLLQDALEYRKRYFQVTGRHLGFDPNFARQLGLI